MFYSTSLERGAQSGSSKWSNHPKISKITKLQGVQISTDLKICSTRPVLSK